MSAPAKPSGEPITSRRQLVEYLESGCKPPEQWRIGTEHEKFAYTQDDLRPLTYEGERGVRAVLDGLRKFGWQPVSEGGNVIALVDDAGASVTLEPGGQLELSGAPLDSIHQTCCETYEHLKQVKQVASRLRIGFLGMGFQPKWQRDDVPWMPKGRYKIMGEYMPKRGGKGLDMMLRTCTVQVNLDFASEADMVKIIRLLLSILCFALMIYCLSGKNACSFDILILPISFIIALALCIALNSIHLNTFSKSLYQRAVSKNIAMIDASMGERFDMSSASENNIDGLLYNLMRAKIPTMISPDFKTGLNSKMLIIAAPSKTIKQDKAKSLKEYVYNGGTLILSAGYECNSQVYNLLNLFEVSIKPVLLGPVPWEDSYNHQTVQTNNPKFKEAWPIQITNPSTTKSYYTFKDYNMVTISKVGKGKFIMIGDSKFLFSSNLEQLSSANIENVKFIQNLLKDVESYD